MENCEKDSRNLLAGCLWGIWKFRNVVVFNITELPLLEDEVQKAIKVVKEYISANSKVQATVVPNQERWTLPDLGWFKINSDVGITDSGKSQIGVVVRDHAGAFLSAAQETATQIQHPTLLEAVGIRMSIDVAISMGLTKVIFESDCQLVI